jgi:hypothetical protein
MLGALNRAEPSRELVEGGGPYSGHLLLDRDAKTTVGGLKSIPHAG